MQDETTHDRGGGRRRTVLRWVRRAIGPTLVASLIFGAVSYSADSGVEQAQPIHYREECLGEGCSNHELRELWSGLESECFEEVCWTEEVFELSGGESQPWYPYHRNSRIPEMFKAFRTRLGERFEDPMMLLGPTQTVWTRLVKLIDGVVFKTPEFNCDPWCGKPG